MQARGNTLSDDDSGRRPDLEEGNIQRATSTAAEVPREVPTSPLSLRRMHVSPADASSPVSPSPPGQNPVAAERFRKAVRKVMALHRTSTMLASGGAAGAEPGVDPRKSAAAAMYGHIHQTCTIEIVDYSSVQYNLREMSNTEFVQMMQSTKNSKRDGRLKVRWINIAGVSWDVISALALRYDLHPLALEDILHQPRSGLLSKVDYYHRHLFLRVLCHTLPEGEDHEHDPMLYADPALNHSYGNLAGGITGLPRNVSPAGEKDYDEDYASGSQRAFSRLSTSKRETNGLPLYTQKVDPPRTGPHKSTSSHTPLQSQVQRSKLRHAQAIERLKRGDRVDVKIQPLCIFLLRDGTVISLSRGRSLAFTTPIRDRLRHAETGLRESADAAMLVQALLDLLVDRVFEVIDAYHTRILALEHAVLLRPRMKHVSALHIIQADLNQIRRTLEPVKTVAYGLRRYDVDRAAALIPEEERHPSKPVKGFMTHKAKIYLADVVDNMDYVLTNLDMFSGTVDNLINYSFNMSSNQMNQVMKRLTLATIIFLPLTLLTGYFGMNFNSANGGFWSVRTQSDAFFWALAIPLVFVMVCVFMWSDFRDMAHYVRKRLAARHDAQVMMERKRA